MFPIGTPLLDRDLFLIVDLEEDLAHRHVPPCGDFHCGSHGSTCGPFAGRHDLDVPVHERRVLVGQLNMGQLGRNPHLNRVPTCREGTRLNLIGQIALHVFEAELEDIGACTPCLHRGGFFRESRHTVADGGVMVPRSR